MKFVKNLLIEKPPSLNFKDAKTLSKKSKINKNNIFVALNRSYFESTIEAVKKIQNKKTKRIVKVTDQEMYTTQKGITTKVLKRWMYANSIHMVDYFRIFCRGSIKNNPSKYIQIYFDRKF